MDETREKQLAGLLERCLEGLERAGPAGAQAVLDEVAARDAALADDLRRQLGALQAAGLLSDDESADVPETLGDFRLLRRLGGGGMGVVYLARQQTLGRTVALKLIRPEQLYFPGARERFRREVEAVARLAHPGIVPIHTVGEEGGVPFFAMEHLAGATLAEIIAEVSSRKPEELTGRDLEQALAAVMARRGAELPAVSPRSTDTRARLAAGSWVAACLRLVRQAAEALHHAHERGILHRDVKPSNLVLQPDGRVVLIDFGLAAAEGSSRITRTGLQLGSLAYMSPERLDGEGALDARSDIYSLGVTLHELLTLRIPYEAATAEGLRQLVREGRPTPPRELNAAVPREAETVCLVAMEADPRRRYATALALAEDLGRVLELRPIAARRPSAWLRARRFVQRHPAGSTALLLGGLLVIGGPAAYIVQQEAANKRIQLAFESEKTQREEAERQRTEAENQRAEAEHQKDAAEASQWQAEANFLSALSAVDTVTRTSEVKLKDIPGLEEVRSELLEDVLRFYETFLEQNADNPALAAHARSVAGRAGKLHQALGQWEEARAVQERGLEIAEAMLARDPDDPEALAATADALMAMHGNARFRGDFAEAERAARRGVELLRRLHEAHPYNSEHLQQFASGLDALARVEKGLGHFDESERLSREAMGHVDRILEVNPGHVLMLEAAAQLRNNLASTLNDHTDRKAEAEQLFRDAIAFLEQRLEADPDSTDGGSELGTTQANLASLLVKAGRLDEAEELLRAALARQDQMLADFPGNIFVRRGVAVTTARLGQLCQQRQRLDEAEELLRRSFAERELLYENDPAGIMPRSDFTVGLNNLGGILRLQGRHAEALPLLERGLALHGGVFAQSKGITEHTVMRGLHSHLARTQLALGDHASAAATAQALPLAMPGDTEARTTAATLLDDCSAAARADERLGAEERVRLADGYAAQASALRTP